MNNKLYDSIELQDMVKGYVVIKEDGKTIIEGFNTIVNDGRSFIISKMAANAFATTLAPATTNADYVDYSNYKFSKIYFCEATVKSGNNEKIAKATEVTDTLVTYEDFVAPARSTRYAQDIDAEHVKYDPTNREFVLQYNLTGTYEESISRVISSVILTVKDPTTSTEKMFSRFTFDPKVIAGNANIQIYYHIHF